MSLLPAFLRRRSRLVPKVARLLELERMAALEQQRAMEPIPFHPPTSFLGIGADPRAHALLRAVSGSPAIATRPIVDRIASLRFEVVAQERVSDGTVEEMVIDDHPLQTLLNAPSNLHSLRQLLRLTAYYYLTVGEAYWLKVTQLIELLGLRLELPVALYAMIPSRVSPILSGGDIVGYSVMDGNGEMHTLEAREVVRIWNPDPETLYTSRGTLGPQGRTVDAQAFEEEHLRHFFQNNATPNTVLVPGEGAQTPDEPAWRRWLSAWRQSQHGRDGQHTGSPAKLPMGWDIKELNAHGGRASELVPLLEFFHRQHMQSYGTPRSVVGEVVSGDRSSAETNQFVFDMHTVTPIADLIVDGVNQHLVPDYPQPEGIRLMVRYVDFVATDKQFDLAREDQDLRTKVRSVNQVRVDRGLDETEWGEFPVGTFNEIPYTGEEAPLPAPMTQPPSTNVDGLDASDESDERASSPTLTRAQARHALETVEGGWARVLGREKRFVPRFDRRVRAALEDQRNAALRMLRASERSRQLDDDEIAILRLEFADAWRENVDPARAAVYRSEAEDMTALIGAASGIQIEPFAFNERVVAFLRVRSLRLITQADSTTVEVLREELAEGAAAGESVDQLAKRINSVFAGRRRNSRTIARTEVLKAASGAQEESARQSGVVQSKTWQTSLDEAVRDSHEIDGQTVGLDSPYRLRDGVLASAPGLGWEGRELPAGDSINCRCFEVYGTQRDPNA